MYIHSGNLSRDHEYDKAVVHFGILLFLFILIADRKKCGLLARPPRGHSARWYRTGDCCIARLRWTGGSGCPFPSVPWRTQNDSLDRPPHNPSWAAWCLKNDGQTEKKWYTRTFSYESQNQNHYFHAYVALKLLQVAAATKSAEQISLLERRQNYSRGTQDPNLSGNSDNRSSFILSFTGPRMMMGLA